MFVPRSLRLKGVQETEKRKPNKPQDSDASRGSSDDAPVQAMQTPAPLKDPEQSSKPAATKASKLPTSTEYLGQLAAGVELIFTDYAHQDPHGARWLQERYRTIDGEAKYIHLAAVLEHPNISTLKPQATQLLLRQAIQSIPNATLELSSDGFYVRRRPTTYPVSFVPSNSFALADDDGLSFWDQRTIYVEPHIRHMCKTPAKVAHWLTEHGQLKAKWLPVQAVHTLYNSCAFVVLSGNVMHEDQWQKWREGARPENWRIMTKVENLRRTEEYVALLERSRGEVRRTSSKVGSGVGGTLDKDMADAGGQEAGQKKRKRAKESASGGGGADAAMADEMTNEESPDVDGERTGKRRA